MYYDNLRGTHNGTSCTRTAYYGGGSYDYILYTEGNTIPKGTFTTIGAAVRAAHEAGFITWHIESYNWRTGARQRLQNYGTM